MVKVKKFGVLSMAKIYMITMAIFGLIEGLLFAIIGSLLSAALESGAAVDPVSGLLAGLGWIGVIVLPIVFGIIGFVAGAFGAWIYNLAAKWVGGIEVELEQ